jgi:hypothetical protein
MKKEEKHLAMRVNEKCITTKGLIRIEICFGVKRKIVIFFL